MRLYKNAPGTTYRDSTVFCPASNSFLRLLLRLDRMSILNTSIKQKRQKKADMEERTIIEVEAMDAEQLKNSLGIPEDDIYVELVPDIKLFWSGEKVRRGGTDILPYVVEFIIAVAAPLTVDAVSYLVKRIREGGGQTITIVKRYEINITIEEKKTIDKLQKLLTAKDDDDQ